MTSAIIVAAGNSRRMGFNKLTALLASKPVLRWSMEAFEKCPSVDEWIVVAGEAVAGTLAEWQSQAAFSKPWKIVAGGAERFHSVFEGLRQVSPEADIVAVHDGARPLISPGQISLCVERARIAKAVACARPVTETLKRADAAGVITGSIEREGAWIMETPQVFDRALLCEAYERILRDQYPVTDEVSAAQYAGARVYVVNNPEPNPKITYPADLAFAEKLLTSTG